LPSNFVKEALMSRIKSWTAKAAHSLSAHLDRLRETLDRLHGRLREAVAEAVSGGAANAVKDAVLAAMLASEVSSAYEAQTYRTSSAAYDPPRYRYGSSWNNSTEDTYRPSWERDPYDDPDRYEPDEINEPTSQSLSPSAPEAVGRRFGQAIAIGCQAAAWWLRRKSNARYSALAAVGVGAAAGATAYFVGPVIAAAAALAGSTLGLTALSQAARHGAAVLFGAASS
jgi:hypothetical protein